MADDLEDIASQLGFTPPSAEMSEEEYRRYYIDGETCVELPCNHTKVIMDDSQPRILSYRVQHYFADGSPYDEQFDAGFCSICVDEYKNSNSSAIRPLSVHSALRCLRCHKLLCLEHATISKYGDVFCEECRKRVLKDTIIYVIIRVLTFPVWFFFSPSNNSQYVGRR